ncbi:MAG TPA: hypothetical protein VGS22_23955 [Thermoanaerobaculia bacterium]|jgi:hypothetical protein|nr:hypothetical protein [Thermoanaerobaculia bacterium]
MGEKQKGVVQRLPVVPSPIAGTFTFPGHRAAPTVPLPVMVRRPHTNPARVELKIGVSRRFRGTGGTLEESGHAVAFRWFGKAVGGPAVIIPPSGLPLTAAQLNRGFHLFAESNVPSESVGDYVLTLVLAGGPDPLATPPASVALTAVRLTLDVFPPGPRFGPGAPGPMPEPPAAAPPAGTATDKWFLGRTVNVQDAPLSEARAHLHVPLVEPSGFAGNLSLRQRALSGVTLGKDTARAALFDDDNEPPLPGAPPVVNVAHTNPFAFPPPSIVGRDFFVEGRALGAARRDVAFQLGFEGGEPDGDRVAFTVGVGCSISIANPLRAVVLKKARTKPARQPLTLRTRLPFSGTGLLDRSLFLIAVDLFRAATGGVELKFDGVDNRFTGKELSDGLTLFAAGRTRSGAVDDYRLTLTLEGGSPPAGLPAEAKMTTVELTLDVFLSRLAAGGAGPLMPTADRDATGRFVQVASPTASHERAHLIVRPPNPNLSCDLILRALGAAPAAVRLFTEENAGVGREVILPEKIASASTSIGDFDRFAEGLRSSAAALDTGFQLGIDTLEVDGDRVPMTALEFAVCDDDTVASPPLPTVRFGLWDQAYNPGPAATPNQTTLRANFIDADRRRFHFHLRGPLGAATLATSWRTVRADRTTADDAPASQVLTLNTPAGGGRLVSPGVMLVIDDTDAAKPTPVARGAAEHRLRRARLDGFVRAEIPPAPGQLHRLVIPVFDRATPFSTTSASVAAGGGAASVVVPAAMKGTAATGARWQIKVGTHLVVDTGAAQEEVTVTAVAAASFTATFANAHNGGAGPIQIAGTTDERRRLSVRVVRYNNAADPTYVSARNGDIGDQFTHANLRWNQVGLQIDAGATADRTIPAGALDGTGKFPFAHPNGATEQAALADLIPITPDNTITAVFVDMTGANAYAAILPTLPVPLPAGGTVTMGDRYFIFLQTRLDPDDETLAHELYHVLHNRGHAAGLAVPDQFFTYNTNPPGNLVFPRGLVLPDSLIYRRIQVLNSANPNLDPNNDDVLNWFRRPRTARFPTLSNLNPATATTGNNLTEDF